MNPNLWEWSQASGHFLSSSSNSDEQFKLETAALNLLMKALDRKKKRGFQGQEEEGRRAGRERGREDSKSEHSLLLGGGQGQRNKEAES